MQPVVDPMHRFRPLGTAFRTYPPCLSAPVHPGSPLALLLLALLLAAGCEGGADRAGPVVWDSAGVTIVENFTARWGFGDRWRVAPAPALDIGVMEGDPNRQFFQVAGAIRMPDGRIVVANGGSGEIRFFDEGGEFLAATGRKGGGPGEYQDMFFLRRTRGDSLLVYDWSNRRMSVLTPEGAFARMFELTVLTTSGGFPIVADPFPDGTLLLATDMFLTSGEFTLGAKRDSAVYYIMDLMGRVTDTLGVFPGGESYQTMDGETWVGGGLVFGRYGTAAVSGDGFYYGSSDRFEIENRNRNGDLRRQIRLDVPNPEVYQDDIQRYVADRMARARDEERRQTYRTMFENMPFPQTMPAHGELRVDAEDNLWVEGYRRPGDEQPRWRVFDPSGAFLGTVDTPQRFQIYEIGSDYLLGRWRDDLDVEHVQIYQLLKG